MLKIKKIQRHLDQFDDVYVQVDGRIDGSKPPLIVEIIPYEDKHDHVQDIMTFLKATEYDIAITLTNPKNRPSMANMIRSLSRAVGSTAKNAILGKPTMATKEETNKRMAICKTCDKFNHRRNTCGLCGCRMKYKTALSTSRCPDNPPKW